MSSVIFERSFLLLLALICGVLSYRQYKRIGHPMTNKWFYSTDDERQKMDIRVMQREYRLAANTFALVSIMLITGLFRSHMNDATFSAVIGIQVAAITIYAIGQTIANLRYYNSIGS